MITTVFQLINAGGVPSNTVLNISPVNAPFSYSGSIVSEQSVYLDDTTGIASASLVPTAYTVREMGYNGNTTFLIDLSNATDGTTVSASAYLASSPQVPVYTASYSLFAVTASYASNGGGGGSSALQVIVGSYTNPNSNLTPTNTTLGCLYYQDAYPTNLWNWSVISQSWRQVIGI